jgi:hypothetical protein
MRNSSIEERVATLKAQVATLFGLQTTERKKDWRRTVGMFAGDEIMREICESAAAIREDDRRRTLAELDAQEEQAK